MAKNSKIEWTHHTANLWWGCQKVHAGCDNCYAEVLDNRWKGGHWGAKAPRRLVKSVWSDLQKFQKAAAAAGEVHRVFVGSMMDIFEKPMPLVDTSGNEIQGRDTGWLRDLLFQQISAGIYPNLMFLLLTKRPGNILKYIPSTWIKTPPENVMFGTSVVDQKTADRYIPELLRAPGRHFLSMEPLLGPVDLCSVFGLYEYAQGEYSLKVGSRWEASPDWVIVGGESGHHARPMHPDWARSLRDQCAAAGVPFLFKQWGEWLPGHHCEKAGLLVLSMDNVPGENMFPEGDFITADNWRPGATSVYRVGKKSAGRLLDGIEHNGLPT